MPRLSMATVTPCMLLINLLRRSAIGTPRDSHESQAIHAIISRDDFGGNSGKGGFHLRGRHQLRLFAQLHRSRDVLRSHKRRIIRSLSGNWQALSEIILISPQPLRRMRSFLAVPLPRLWAE